MKVLVVHNAYQSQQIGGEDLVVRREIKALEQVLGPENVFEYIVSNDELRPSRLALTIWGKTKHNQQIIRLIKQHQIDIVHVHNFFPLLTASVFEAAKKAGAKVVHTLHNFRWWCSNGILYQDKSGHCEKCVNKKLGWPAVRYACYRHSRLQSLAATLALCWYRYKQYQQHIDTYFALSHFQLNKLTRLLPAEKLRLKANFIDEPLTRYPIEMKKDFLFVGRLEVAKGADLLLSTWQQLPPHFHLTVIGTVNSHYLNKYQRPNITFLGKMAHEEVLTMMAHAKYLIHPSLTDETFGLTMVEALAQGTPVIGIDKGTRREFIHSGVNGFLCSPTELLSVLQMAMDYPDYASLSQQAYESAQPFYVKPIIHKQLALYQEAMLKK